MKMKILHSPPWPTKGTMFMPENEQYRWPWTETDDGFCTEVSELQTNGFLFSRAANGEKLKLPKNTGFIEVDLSSFSEQRDKDNDITHWEVVIGNQRYVIFND